MSLLALSLLNHGPAQLTTVVAETLKTVGGGDVHVKPRFSTTMQKAPHLLHNEKRPAAWHCFAGQTNARGKIPTCVDDDHAVLHADETHTLVLSVSASTIPCTLDPSAERSNEATRVPMCTVTPSRSSTKAVVRAWGRMRTRACPSARIYPRNQGLGVGYCGCSGVW